MLKDETAPTLHRSRSANRVLALLDAVVTTGPVPLTEVATRLEIPTSTALRHLRVLVDNGYVTKDDLGRYSAGPTFLRLGLAAFRAGPYAQLIAAARPELDRLVDLTEESAYLAVRDGSEAVYIATSEGTRAIRHVGWVGRSVPLVGTAIGSALLSQPTPPDGRLESFVNTGAIESDVTSVVAPIRGPGRVIGAFSVLGPADRLRGDRLESAAAAVVAAAMATAEVLSSATMAS